MSQRRYELSDEQWEQIKDEFPPYKTGRPPKRTNREYFNGILWLGKSGAAWRVLPENKYESWETIYTRFCNWRDSGLLISIFQKLNEEADFENLSIDSISIRAHQHSAGAKKRRRSRR